MKHYHSITTILYSIVALYSKLNSTTVTVKGHRVAVSTLIGYPVSVGTGLWS